ncbi:hypothetical protein PAUR_a3329 [Pseudoalteromonas aurantia 208]|uniref:Uncharacterized protein n=1 Tax=Pseudoalteromonas aurantia 208 TaxID=1314867 RepID=A0ABR9E5S9_9GAMM|nr:hypothetical protein [Pseudoalteromonas aurantia 208]
MWKNQPKGGLLLNLLIDEAQNIEVLEMYVSSYFSRSLL